LQPEWISSAKRLIFITTHPTIYQYKVNKMAKDKILGVILLVLGAIIIVFYTLIGPVDLILESLGSDAMGWLRNVPGFNWKFSVVVPMWIVVLLVCVVMIWIGYSMITTPPPVPLEELEEELEREEEASK